LNPNETVKVNLNNRTLNDLDENKDNIQRESTLGLELPKGANPSDKHTKKQLNNLDCTFQDKSFKSKSKSKSVCKTLFNYKLNPELSTLDKK